MSKKPTPPEDALAAQGGSGDPAPDHPPQEPEAVAQATTKGTGTLKVSG